MKKLSLILLAAIILTSFLTVHSEETMPIQIIASEDTISVEVDEAEGLITLIVVEGDKTPALLDNGVPLNDIAVHFDQLKADFSGKAVFQFKMPEKYKTGKYNFCIFCQGKSEVREFRYFDKNAKSDVIKLINDAKSSDEISVILNNPVNIAALAFHFEPFSSMIANNTDMTFIYEKLLNHEAFNPEDASEIIGYLKEVSLLNIINQSAPEATRETLLGYSDMLMLDTAENSYLYKRFTEASQSEQLRIIKAFSKDYQTISDISVDFRECVFLDSVEHMDYFKNTEAFLHNASSVLSSDLFSVYNKLKNKNPVLQKISNERYKSIDNFCEQFILLSRQQYNSENSTSAPGGGGGGGGGGGKAINVTAPASSDDGNAPADQKQEAAEKEDFFSDLISVPWAKDAVYSLYNKNILHGKTPDRFFPNDYITREEFIKIIVLSFDSIDEYTDISFNDVKDTDWSYPYICKGYEKNIIQGTGNDTFSPKAFITREDMAVILYRLSVKQNLTLTAFGSPMSFADSDDISSYAVDAINALYQAGIIKGTSETTVSPKEHATRAQAAQIIYNYMIFKGEN